jgi:high-affinity Fe2+/Pb2+ permease
MSSLVDTLIGGATNAATGGILGLVGNAVQGLASYFNSKAQYAHDEAMADKQLAATRVGDADKLAQIEQQGAWDSFKASVGSTVGSFASGVLTVAREGVTLYLLVLATVIYQQSTGDVQASIGRDIVVLAGMAVSWHFGQKPTLNFATQCARASVVAPKAPAPAPGK